MSDLIERLRREVGTGFVKMIGEPLTTEVHRMDNGTLVAHQTFADSEPCLKLRNPDGPEAATEIETLRARVEALEGALGQAASGLACANNLIKALGGRRSDIIQMDENAARSTLKGQHDGR